MRNFLHIAMAWLLISVSLSSAEASKRVALVIGNSEYANVTRLKNPINDAQELADTLRSIGFSKVTLKLDQSYSDLRLSLGQFSRDAAGADIALLYFAGHGIEVGGVNYAIPVDARLSHVDDVEFEAVELSKLLSSLNRASKLKLVILDACRNNPFQQSMANTGSTRSVGRGLARVSPSGSDTLVAYAAKEGTVADDGNGENSPYAKALIKHMRTPGLDVRLLFGRVRDDVLASTGRRQEPFTYGSLGGEQIHLSPPQARIIAEPQPNSIRPVVSELDRELVFWDSIKSSTATSDFEAYLEQFPSGTFTKLAKGRLSRLRASEAANAKRKEDEAAKLAEQETTRQEIAKALLRDRQARDAWNRVKHSTSTHTLGKFVAKYPNTHYATLARTRFHELLDKGRQKHAVLQVPKKNKVVQLVGSTEPKVLGRFGNWAVAAYDSDDGVVCYTWTKPLRSSPARKERKKSDISFIIKSELKSAGSNIKNEPSANFGIAFKSSSNVSIKIDGREFDFIINNNTAFMRHTYHYSRFVDAVKKGRSMVVSGISQTGRSYTDRYGLRGVTRALARVEEACPSEN